MITSMHIENFKCFKDFDIELGPFNVFVGPNDTGKTALLQAIRLASRAALDTGVGVPMQDVGPITGANQWTDLIWQGNAERKMKIAVQLNNPQSRPQQSTLVVVHGSSRPTPVIKARLADRADEGLHRDKEGAIDHLARALGPTDADREWLAGAFGEAGYYRLAPRSLRLEAHFDDSFEEDGSGLPAFLDQINRTDREVFLGLEKHFYRRFPQYRRLELPLVTGGSLGGQALTVRFRTAAGELLPSELVSDGVMLSLAFLALAYQISPPKVLMIEEPENGVHPASLSDTVDTLRKLSDDKGVQVFLTTHSPYLLDEVESEVVHVFTKDDEEAVHAKKLSDFDDVGDMKKDFMTGEIWSILSKAHGI